MKNIPVRVAKDEQFGQADGPHRMRFLWIDIARTIALLAMVVSNFIRDLEFFRLIPPGTILTGFWAAFARLIAGSFLYLSGVRMVVAHGREVRLGSWGKRLATIAAAAMFVTLVTYAALPDHFIYFGILHALAVTGLFGIALRKAPACSYWGQSRWSF
ncbi:heparan-alpha-glucosaminide N-acetyltransferase [Tropicimonas aquimaris]|uniref:Heparan-alpha-glucosaminide N-acetyltransferase n=1 Tax=Tropicimonas aquimaris TaxID=914152 RepID=A0ABW3IWJ3_9RHOB